MVGISGGEPFVERRGLVLATERFAAAGKDIVLYTSGIWANPVIPAWISSVLSQASCVFLSTDAFHAAAIDDERFVRAAQTIASAGPWIIVQVLKLPEMVEKAKQLLQKAFGEEYEVHAELSLISPLPYGRAAHMFAQQVRHRGETFGTCNALASQVVRYDGVISACCNERVLMGFGPERLRRRVASADGVVQGTADIRADATLNILSQAGAGILTYHPLFADLADREFSSICELCWEMQKRLSSSLNAPDRLLSAMTILGRSKTE